MLFAVFPVPLHPFFCFVEGPAGVRARRVADEAKRALLVVDDGTDHAPVGSYEEFLLLDRSRRDGTERTGDRAHLATDALVSAGVVIAGFIISYTGIAWIDPLISLLIMAVVSPRSI